MRQSQHQNTVQTMKKFESPWNRGSGDVFNEKELNIVWILDARSLFDALPRYPLFIQKT